MQQLIRVQSARAGECDRPDRNRLHSAKQPSSPTFASFLSSLPHSVYLPLSHRLCGSAVCCLVTGWSELDIIMTAMLIRPDPIFHLHLGLSGCLRSGPACQMKSARTDKTNRRQQALTFWWSSYEAQCSHTKRNECIFYLKIIQNNFQLLIL